MERPMVSRVLNDAANVSAAKRRSQETPVSRFAIVEPPTTLEKNASTRWVTYREPAQAQWTQFQPEPTSTQSTSRTPKRYVCKLTSPSSDTQQTFPATVTTRAHKSSLTGSLVALNNDTAISSTFKTSSVCGTDFQWMAVPASATALVSECRYAPSHANIEYEEHVATPAMTSSFTAQDCATSGSGIHFEEETTASTSDTVPVKIESHPNALPEAKIDLDDQVAPIKYRKVAVLPSNILPGYPGFCDVNELTLEERKPWLFLGKKKQKEIQKASKQIVAKKSPPKQYTITPRTWREQIKLSKKNKNTTEVDNKKTASSNKVKNITETVNKEEDASKEDKTDERSSILDDSNSQNIGAHNSEDGDQHSPKKSRIEEEENPSSDPKGMKQSQRKISYDQKTAREYMQKQRQRQKEKCMKELQEKKQAEEIKKHNYKMLLEKTTKLVKSNLKRTLKPKLTEEITTEDGLNADSKEPDRKRVLVPPAVKLQRSPRKRSSAKYKASDLAIPQVLQSMNSQKSNSAGSKPVVTEPAQTSSRSLPSEAALEPLSTDINSVTHKHSGERWHISNPHKSSQFPAAIVAPPQTNTGDTFRAIQSSGSNVEASHINIIDKMYNSIPSLEVKLPSVSTYTLTSQSSEPSTESSQTNIDGKSYFRAVPSSLSPSTYTTAQSTGSALETSQSNIYNHRYKTTQIAEVVTKPLQAIISDKAYYRAIPSSRGMLPLSNTFKTAETSGNSAKCSETNIDPSNYYRVPSFPRGALPLQSTDNEGNNMSTTNDEAMRLAVDATQKVNEMNHKLQTALTLATEPKHLSGHGVSSNVDNVDVLSIANMPPLKTDDRDVTESLIRRMQKLNQSVEQFKDISNQRDKIISKQRKDTYKVHQPSSSDVASMPSESARAQRRRTRKLTTKYPYISLPGEHHSTFHRPSLHTSVENPPGSEGTLVKRILDCQRRHQAAIKIQALYRGHTVRNNLGVREVLKSRSVRKKYQYLKYSIAKHHHHSDSDQKPLPETSVVNEEMPAQELPYTDLNWKQPEVLPDWLQPELLQPCPYNFMTAVKRKLDLLKSDSQQTSKSDPVEIKSSDVNKMQRLAQTVSTENDQVLDESHYIEDKYMRNFSSVAYHTGQDKDFAPSGSKTHVSPSKEVPQQTHDSMTVILQENLPRNMYNQSSVLSSGKSDNQYHSIVDEDITPIHSSIAAKSQKSQRKKHRLKGKERFRSRESSKLNSSRSTSEDLSSTADKQHRKGFLKRPLKFKVEKEKKILLVNDPTSVLFDNTSLSSGKTSVRDDLSDTQTAHKMSAKDIPIKNSSPLSVRTSSDFCSTEENAVSDVKYTREPHHKKREIQVEASVVNQETLPTEILFDTYNRRQAEVLTGWLQPQPIKPCPYNFITAVKRKLELLTRDDQMISDEVKSLDTNNVNNKGQTSTRPDYYNYLSQHKSVQTLPLSPISTRRVSEETGKLSDRNIEFFGENVNELHSQKESTIHASHLMSQEAKDESSPHVKYEQSSFLLNDEFGQHPHDPTFPGDVLSLNEYSRGSVVSSEIPVQQSWKNSTSSQSLVVPDVALVRSSSSEKTLKSHQKKHKFKAKECSHFKEIPKLHSPQHSSEDVNAIDDQHDSKNTPEKAVKYQTKGERNRVVEKELISGAVGSTLLFTDISSDKDTPSIHSTRTSQEIPVEEIDSLKKVTSQEMTIEETPVENNIKSSNEEIPGIASEGENTVFDTRHSVEHSTKNLEIRKVFHPTALHLQFQAELNLLDSVEESRRQLATVESLRAITLAQQGTSAVASALKTTKELHKHEVGELEKKAVEVEEKMIETFARERTEFERLLDSVKKNTPQRADNGSLTSVDVASKKYSQSKDTEGEEESNNSNKSSTSLTASIPEKVEAISLSTEKTIPDTNEDSFAFSFTSISEQISDRELSSMGVSEKIREQLHYEVLPEEAEPLRKQKHHPTYSYLKTTLLMFEKQLKHEDVRNQEQIALLNLREKTLVDRAKADMTWLEVKKSQFREKGRENLIPTIKKKQRALVMKLQNDIVEIKRLKKSQKISSDERKLVMIQQQHLLKMQLLSKTDSLVSRTNTKKSTQLENIEPLDIVLSSSSKSSKINSQRKKLETSDKPSKNKGSLLSGATVTDISEHVPSSHSSSENSLHGHRKMEIDEKSSGSKTFKSIDYDSSEVIEDISQATSSVVSEVLDLSGNKSDSPKKKVIKTLGEQVLKYMKTLEKHKRYLTEQEKILLLRRHSVEELLLQRKRLEEEEQKLAEAERQAIALTSSSKISHKPVTTIKSLQDRGTSPVQVLDKVSSSSEKMESKSKSSAISENVVSTSDQSFHQSNHTISEEIPESYSRPSSDIPSALTASAGVSHVVEQYASESFGSPESPETPRTEMPAPHSTSEVAEELEQSETRKIHVYNKSKAAFRAVVKSKKSELVLKAPLSPLNQGQQKRRYSSGSDESIIYSQTETPSEQSDLEGRVSALLEQLRRRKLEAEKLRREQKRTQRERLKIKEQSLLKQIQAYDSYIQRTKEELEQELDTSTVSFTKPKIKQPRVAEKSTARGKEDERKRLSLPSEPVTKLPATDTEIGSGDRSLYEQAESGTSSVVSKLPTDPTISNFVPVSDKSSEEPIELQSSIADEIATEVSYSDPEVSTAISLTSEKEINEKSIDGSSNASGSQRSISPDSSLETTIQSPIKISELELETKESSHLKSLEDKHEPSVPEISNELSLIEELVDDRSDINTELEKSDSHLSEDILEEEHLSISSGGLAEDPEEFSTEKNSDVIKVFLTEKVVKSGPNSQDEPSVEKDTSVKSSASSLDSVDIKDSQQDSILRDNCDLSQKTVDDKSEDLIEALPLEKATTETDDLKALKKHYLVESITDTIFNELLKESLCIPTRTMKQVCCSETSENIATDSVNQFLVAEESHVSFTREDILPNEKLGHDDDTIDYIPSVNNKSDTDNVTTMLLNQYVNDATNEVLRIYHLKKKADQSSHLVAKSALSVDSSADSQEDDGSIRNRVHKILAETALSLNSPRETSRLQDFMVTTYDVLSPSPEDTPSITPDLGFPTKGTVEGESDELGELKNLEVSESKVELGVGLSVGGESEGADNEGFTQEWFDEDFGLSNTRREAEELRLQQLQIEQEIQQLQQAQEQIPFFYVREIPNKPPPPYTPPGQTSRSSSSPAPGVPRIPLSKQDLTRLASEESRIVPATRSELCALASVATDFLYSAIAAGADLDLVEAPPQYYDEEDGDADREKNGDDMSDTHKASQSIFKTFIFDLTKQLVKDAYSWEADEPCAPWQWPACSRKRKKIAPRSREMLQEIVSKQVLVLFGFIPKAGKENLVIRWSRKRRDYVDELLMRESHEEEPGWTNYDQDEVTLKNEVTMSIYNSLLDDTVNVMMDIIDKKVQRHQQRTLTSIS